MPRKTIETNKNIKVQEKKALVATRARDYIYAVGRRKTSIARVRLYKNGDGTITINKKSVDSYFPYFEWKDIVLAPLVAIGEFGNFTVTIIVRGGGIHSQAEAVRAGISRALIKINENFRKTLKPLGFLKRDPRQKERKKPGLKRARRAPQWQKR